MESTRFEARALVALAVPLCIAQLASAALPATDALVMATLGADTLAGGGLGASILSMITVVIGSVFGVLGASLGRARVAGDDARARELLGSSRLVARLFARVHH